MALFESYDRRINQINAALNKYGIKDIDEAKSICEAKGLDPYKMCKDIQPICFENAAWAYVVGAAIAIKKGCKKAAEAAEKKAKRAERWKKLDSVVKLGIETREEEEKPDPNDHIVEQGRGYESGWDDIDV